MPTYVLVAVLFAALLHASGNALAKGRGGGDPLIGTLLVGIGSGLAGLPVMAVTGLPNAPSHGFLAASVMFHVGYFLLIGLCFRSADVSAVFPLIRGSAPLPITLAGGILLAEPMTIPLFAGVALLSAGVLGLSAHALKVGSLDGRTVLLALGNVVCVVTYTLLDGLDTRASGNAAAYIAAMLAAMGLLLLPVVLWLEPKLCTRKGSKVWGLNIAGGAMVMASYGIGQWAVTQAPIGAVAALRETSVLFGTVIAAVVLREQFGPARWVAAAAICCGLAVLRLG